VRVAHRSGKLRLGSCQGAAVELLALSCHVTATQRCTMFWSTRQLARTPRSAAACRCKWVWHARCSGRPHARLPGTRAPGNGGLPAGHEHASNAVW